jgi:excisionase family DNA binding protein
VSDESPGEAEKAAVTVGDAATFLSVSADTIRRLIKNGALPHARIGNSIRIRRADLVGFLDSQVRREWEPVDGRGRRTA